MKAETRNCYVLSINYILHKKGVSECKFVYLINRCKYNWTPHLKITEPVGTFLYPKPAAVNSAGVSVWGHVSSTACTREVSKK